MVKMGSTDSCIHKFCFDCIIKWSAVTNKCPICNVTFHSVQEIIIENVIVGKKRKGRKRKPKVVKVRDKEQYVSYEHTGTFDNDEDSDDSLYGTDDDSDLEGFPGNYFDLFDILV